MWTENGACPCRIRVLGSTLVPCPGPWDRPWSETWFAGQGSSPGILPRLIAAALSWGSTFTKDGLWREIIYCTVRSPYLHVTTLKLTTCMDHSIGLPSPRLFVESTDPMSCMVRSHSTKKKKALPILPRCPRSVRRSTSGTMGGREDAAGGRGSVDWRPKNESLRRPRQWRPGTPWNIS